MSSSSDENQDPFSTNAESVGVEPRRFAPEQMVTCDVCLRANPPTRSNCLYCAAELPVSEAAAEFRAPTLRKLEEWESGFNIILFPSPAPALAMESLMETSRLLHLEPEEFTRILEAQLALPVARTSSVDEASLIENKLRASGFSPLVLADDDLLSDATMPRRTKTVEINEDQIVFHSAVGGGAESAPWSDVILLVAGRLFTRRVEVEERKRRKAEAEIVGTREMSADDSVMDIYTSHTPYGWRILASQFDFSCLGKRKELVASQNFRTLTDLILERIGADRYDDSYNLNYQVLTSVWSLGERTESGGWHRRRIGRVNTQVVTASDNELQFTRYSRLLRRLRVTKDSE